MCRQITITEPVWPYCGRTLSAVLDDSGVTVIIDPARPVFVPWDRVTNVEWLAEKCREMRVYELRSACRALYVASTMQEQFKIATTLADTVAKAKREVDWQEYVERTSGRLARMDALAPKCAFDKMFGQRTLEEQAAWDEHERLLKEQLDDEQAQGL